jgi:hypothetical protein
MQSSESNAEDRPQLRTREEAQAELLPTRRGWFRRLIGDVFFVTARDRRWWVLPLILLLLILGGILAFAVTLGPAAPFLYPLL